MMREDTFQKRRAELSAAKQALLEKRLQRSFTPATQALSMVVAAPSSSETTPLSFSQHRLWFLQQLEPQSAVYNEPIAVHLRGPLHLPALAQVATALSLRHAVLRTTFPLQDGQVVQLVHPPEPQQSSLPLLDLSTLPASERQAALHRHIQAEVQRPFDLTRTTPGAPCCCAWRQRSMSVSPSCIISSPMPGLWRSLCARSACSMPPSVPASPRPYPPCPCSTPSTPRDNARRSTRPFSLPTWPTGSGTWRDPYPGSTCPPIMPVRQNSAMRDGAYRWASARRPPRRCTPSAANKASRSS